MSRSKPRQVNRSHVTKHKKDCPKVYPKPQDSEDDDLDGNNLDLDRILDPARYVLHAKHPVLAKQTPRDHKTTDIDSTTIARGRSLGRSFTFIQPPWEATQHTHVSGSHGEKDHRHKRESPELHTRSRQVNDESDWPELSTPASYVATSKERSNVTSSRPRKSTTASMRNLQLMSDGCKNYVLHTDELLRRGLFNHGTGSFQTVLPRQSHVQCEKSLPSTNQKENTPPIEQERSCTVQQTHGNMCTLSREQSKQRKAFTPSPIVSEHLSHMSIEDKHRMVTSILTKTENAQPLTPNVAMPPGGWNGCMGAAASLLSSHCEAPGSRVAECGSDDDQRAQGGVWTPSEHSSGSSGLLTTEEDQDAQTDGDDRVGDGGFGEMKEHGSVSVLDHLEDEEVEGNTSPCKARRGTFSLDWVSSELASIHQVAISASCDEGRRFSRQSSDTDSVMEVGGPGFESDGTGTGSPEWGSQNEITSTRKCLSDDDFWNM